MNKRTIITVSAIIVASTVVIASVAVAGGDDDEQPITGVALTTASQAALAETGEGRVTDTEIGDEESHYEVEVTLDDGRQIDVQLDEDFRVVGSAEDVDDATGDD